VVLTVISQYPARRRLPIDLREKRFTMWYAYPTNPSKSLPFSTVINYADLRTVYSKHVLNAQVSIRSPCCRKWFDCAECHAEQENHPLLQTFDMVGFTSLFGPLLLHFLIHWYLEILNAMWRFTHSCTDPLSTLHRPSSARNAAKPSAKTWRNSKMRRFQTSQTTILLLTS